MTEKTNRDRIRQATLGSKGQFQTETVEINGVNIQVKQPSVGERDELFDDIRDENGNLDHVKILTWGVIRLAHDPESGERVFDDSDYDAMMEHPTNSWVDTLGEAVLRVLNVENTGGSTQGKD